MIKSIDPKYVNQVLASLTQNPPALEEREQLIADFTQIGYWAVVAEEEYEKAQEERRYAEADAMLAAKLNDPKVTQSLLEANARKAAKAMRDKEIHAKAQAEKLRSLTRSLELALES